MRRRTHFLSIATLFMCGLAIARAQESLPALLHQNRSTLTVQNGEMAGPGSDFLKREIATAQFVAIGEEHGTREIPEFAWAVCRAMAVDGLDAMAVEAGPLTTEKLAQWAAAPDGARQLAAWKAKYPDSIAFYVWQSEFQLLSRCQQAAAPHKLSIWGLDQEFLGSPNFLLQAILDNKPGPSVATKAQALLSACTAYISAAVASGKISDLCILHSPASAFIDLEAAARTSGNTQAERLALALAKTEHIYTTHTNGHSYEANHERALYLKQNFTVDYLHLVQAIGHQPRILFKFGSNHIYRGFDVTNVSNLGNYISEFADERGLTSLHIFAVGTRGQEEHFTGPGKPDEAVDVDLTKSPENESSALAAFYPEADPNQWTLFDLRPLRPKLRSLGQIDRELERLILGYDLVVIIPHVTADSPISLLPTAR